MGKRRVSMHKHESLETKMSLYSLLELVERPVGTLVDILLGSGKVKGLDSANTLRHVRTESA